MADDKIVTKKTAAKKTASKKAASKKATVSKSSAKTTPAPETSAKVAKKTAAKRTTKKTAAKAATPKTAPAAAPQAHALQPVSERSGSLHRLASVSPAQRLKMVEEAAYYRAEKRNFAPGHEAEDWALAEQEIDELIARAKTMTGR
ncbi:DUF2934 domain-containing protein [Thiorhodococcus minor]|uniref:DUF2934 domain-containing protein n=1 Tax=Thiorhodococcus minor TaxID=57489 RepID=A0A6M0JT66_9GAMM|nr:DUF2934 domain-containing protein [Thiorhodococcus minor]NEV60688.1 DUF2934 domain-containing protein [Thiorhodococcus minor]